MSKTFASGMVAGMFLSIAGFSGNWLITPLRHPDASNAQRAGVVAQLVLCLAVTAWLVWRHRKSAASAL
ncbi:MAG: hypothetical protein HYV19_05600 [Gemmatimonadetes bacterium]|nr:hypothetical protein [Gemmatimonadota bacterium]